MANCTKNSIGNLRGLVILTNSGRHTRWRAAQKTRPHARGLGMGVVSRFVWAVPKVRPLTPSNKPLLSSLLCSAGMGVDLGSTPLREP